MIDKLKRFTRFCAKACAGFVFFTVFLFLMCALVETKVLILQVLMVVLYVVFIVSSFVGVAFECIDVVKLIRNRITKKAAAVFDPDELQQ